MSEPTKEFPKDPQIGDQVITINRALCGCEYGIRCRWDGKMWRYTSSVWCKPHGSYGMELVEVQPDDGRRLEGQPRNILAEMLDNERDTNGRVSLASLQELTRIMLRR